MGVCPHCGLEQSNASVICVLCRNPLGFDTPIEIGESIHSFTLFMAEMALSDGTFDGVLRAVHLYNRCIEDKNDNDPNRFLLYLLKGLAILPSRINIIIAIRCLNKALELAPASDRKTIKFKIKAVMMPLILKYIDQLEHQVLKFQKSATKKFIKVQIMVKCLMDWGLLNSDEILTLKCKLKDLAGIKIREYDDYSSFLIRTFLEDVVSLREEIQAKYN